MQTERLRSVAGAVPVAVAVLVVMVMVVMAVVVVMVAVVVMAVTVTVAAARTGAQPETEREERVVFGFADVDRLLFERLRPAHRQLAGVRRGAEEVVADPFTLAAG